MIVHFGNKSDYDIVEKALDEKYIISKNTDKFSIELTDIEAYQKAMGILNELQYSARKVINTTYDKTI